jgi:diguanylate cyclase (GGDEF)-like protein/PAS domain S-box-containing protein
MDTHAYNGITPSILVVDDDEVVRLLLHQFLEGAGYHVEEAENGSRALDILARDRFDLVIMDISMPGINGPEVCEQIRTSMVNPPPVLMITALDDDESVECSFQAGAIDYIRKPIRWSVLKNRIRYIIGSYRSQLELESLSKNYELILDAAANGICGLDSEQKISYINPAGLELLGYERSEVMGRPYREIFKASMPGSNDFNMDCCPFFIESGHRESVHFDEIRLMRKDGSGFPADCRSTPILQNNRLTGGVLVYQDITERQQAAELIRYMANHDSLTSLPNRNYMLKRLPQAISLAKRHHRRIFLLFIDLDRFKPINDTYGHGVGDKVLMQVADRLTSMLRTSDSVCRLGGDEFVILLESTGDLAGARLVARKTIKVLNEPIVVDNHTCHIGASVGISIFPDDAPDAETMLRHGDIAMYRAKEKGRNCWQMYRPEKKRRQKSKK